MFHKKPIPLDTLLIVHSLEKYTNISRIASMLELKINYAYFIAFNDCEFWATRTNQLKKISLASHDNLFAHDLMTPCCDATFMCGVFVSTILHVSRKKVAEIHRIKL